MWNSDTTIFQHYKRSKKGIEYSRLTLKNVRLLHLKDIKQIVHFLLLFIKNIIYFSHTSTQISPLSNVPNFDFSQRSSTIAAQTHRSSLIKCTNDCTRCSQLKLFTPLITPKVHAWQKSCGKLQHARLLPRKRAIAAICRIVKVITWDSQRICKQNDNID